MPKIPVELRKLVIVTENHGGMTGGSCVVCDALGWLTEYKYGLPKGHDKGQHYLTHKRSCPVGQHLLPSGKIRRGNVGNKWYRLTVSDFLEDDSCFSTELSAESDVQALIKAKLEIEQMNRNCGRPDNFKFVSLEEVVQKESVRKVRLVKGI